MKWSAGTERVVSESHSNVIDKFGSEYFLFTIFRIKSNKIQAGSASKAQGAYFGEIDAAPKSASRLSERKTGNHSEALGEGVSKGLPGRS